MRPLDVPRTCFKNTNQSFEDLKQLLRIAPASPSAPIALRFLLCAPSVDVQAAGMMPVLAWTTPVAAI